MYLTRATILKICTIQSFDTLLEMPFSLRTIMYGNATNSPKNVEYLLFQYIPAFHVRCHCNIRPTETFIE